MSTKQNIRAKVVGEDGRSSLLRLNIEDKLEIIRKILEGDEKIKMNDKLSFLWSTDSSDVVTRDEESVYFLKDIIKKNTLCLIPDLIKKNIIVKVVGDDNRSLLLRLNIGDKLERIRKILEEDENIKMDDKLFLWSTDIKDAKKVTRNEESDLILINIIKNNTLCLIPEKIRVKVVGDDDRISLLQLNIESKLEIIRKILEEDENIKMDDKLSFSRSTDSSDIKDKKKVTRDEESDLSLRDIIKNNDTLCLIDDYTDFKDRFKLGYGRILTPNKMNIEISKEEVCTMEITVLDNGGDKKDGKDGDFSDFSSKKGWAKKISMFFDGKVEMINCVPAGLSLHDDTIYPTEKKYKFTKVPKITLKLDKFQPKHNFIKEVEKALKSGNFDKIYEDFGQFIPTEVTLGGIVYHETSPNITLTEERDTWECIEFRNPKSIFEILNKELCEKLYKFFGKKILYGDVISQNCHLKYGKKEIVNLPLKGKFREIINNKKADCSVFATVVDKEKKNDFINCQIYYPQNEKPQLIIHCFQKNNQTLRQLKIAFIVVGYDIHFNPNNFNDFNKTKLEVLKNARLFESFESESSFLGIPVLKELNDEPIVIGHYFSKKKENNVEANVFSYNLIKEQCVESSNFNFHVLNIKTSKKEEKEDYETEKNSADYISVCFKNESCSPVFLKKKRKEIKLKNVTCKCNKNCILCENISEKKSKKIKKYIYSQL